jgi:hypothetical protein
MLDHAIVFCFSSDIDPNELIESSPYWAIETPDEQVHLSFRNESDSFPRPRRWNEFLSLFKMVGLEERQLLYQSLQRMREHTDSGKYTWEYRVLGRICTTPHHFIKCTTPLSIIPRVGNNTECSQKDRVLEKKQGVRKREGC